MTRKTAETRGRGFTLIELLVVVSIISLLVSILLPAMSKARRATRQLVCGTRLRGLGQAVGMYMADNDDKYPAPFHPYVWFVGLGTTYGDSPERYTITYQLTADGYLSGDYILDAEGSYRWIEYFRCPETFNLPTSDSAYGINPSLYIEPDPVSKHGHADYIYVGMGGKVAAGSWMATSPKGATASHLLMADVFYRGNAADLYDDPWSANHKGDGTNTLYADGHVIWSHTGSLTEVVAPGNRHYKVSLPRPPVDVLSGGG